jgi:putative glycosyltransferase (TIGR04372 family)
VQPTDPLRFEYLPYLGVPQERQAEFDQRLVDLGLDPNRWFCCIYYREPGYAHRPSVARRDIDPGPFIELASWIIREQGGQVVRIGHAGMTPFPKIEGFIDLIGPDISFMLQANAVARARFGVVTDSGPAALYGAIGTPHAITNAISISTNWRPTDFCLPRHFQAPDGSFLDINDAIAGGYWNDRTIIAAMEEGGYQAVDNSLAELQAATTRLLDGTVDTPGWRPHRDVLADAARYTKRPEQHVTNGPFRHPARIIQFPELAPGRER